MSRPRSHHQTPSEDTGENRKPSRPRKIESYSEWMARIDASVDAAARAMQRRPPTYACLHPAQRRLVELLIEHLRGLPELKPGEDCNKKPSYRPVRRILKELYAAKYPAWELTEKSPIGDLYPSNLPDGEGATCEWIVLNCAGRAPVELEQAEEEDD